MKLGTGWWGIVLMPENERDNEVLIYLNNVITKEEQGIYETGEVKLTKVAPPIENQVYSLEIHR